MSTVFKAFKVRIYPTQEQQIFLNQNLGACRALYNMMLHERIQVYEKLKDNKRELFEYKYKTEKEYKQEFEWMKDADSTSLQLARIDLSKAYQNFFKGLAGKHKVRYGFPKFKKKKTGASYHVSKVGTNLKVDFKNSKIKLPKVDWISFRDKRSEFDGVIKSATVSRTSTDKYFVSILFEQELVLKGKLYDDIDESQVCGLDMSLESFFIDQNGNSPAYERLYRKYEPRLKKAQRQMSRKKKGSKNWYKALHKVSLIHEIISNKRKDFTHKLSTQLVRDNEVIVVEHLSLRGMSQALRLGKSVMDLGYSEFVRQLKYKTLFSNKILVQADKWFASSKTCSTCSYVNKNLQLSDRKWDCPNCGEKHDRDQNAGVNLKNYGLKQIGQGLPEFKPVENKTSTLALGQSQVCSVKQEKAIDQKCQWPLK